MPPNAYSYGDDGLILWLRRSSCFDGCSPPHTQNTAPVFEFRCLYTQDLRRKQKRWQDGRLKFHTFNKRVMVYDERSNFVGDTHWREDTEFAEGEELELERSGIMVEVGECVGKRDQDLTELVDKRVKEREERAAAKMVSPAASLFKSQGTPTSNPLRSKALNALMNPTGHYGRAIVPHTSSFEERQALAGAREKDEQERPAKRRKQNETAPSKSGYAQNLMGATLNLASSRPPSMTTIRYDLVRVKSSMPVPSVPIGLTLDGSDDSDQDTVRRKSGAKESMKSSKLQRTPRRSPPAKCGYASNLTGAALTLSRPESFGQNRPSKISASRLIVTTKAIAREDSSAEEESFSKMPSPKTLHAKAATKRKELIKPSKTRRSPRSLGFPSPPARKEAGQRSVRPSSVIQKSSGIEPTPNRLMSALRIKARPSPKMMMLMDRPSSRLVASAESSQLHRTKSTPMRKQPQPSNQVVLSQATKQLDAFCNKQEEALQARLRGEQRTRIMDLDGLSSSPAGIDHQTIDEPLPRRSGRAPTGSAQTDAVEKQLGQETEQPTLAEQSQRLELLHADPDTSSPPDTSDMMGAQIPRKALRARRDNSATAISDISQSVGARFPSAGISNHESPRHSSPVHEPEHAPAIAQPVQTASISSVPEASKSKLGKPKPLPGHVIGDIQAATEYFRAIIKSSASQQNQLTGVPSHPAQLEREAEVPRPPPDRQEPSAREIPPKTFSELPQPPESELVNEPEPEPGDSEAPTISALEAVARAPIVPVMPLINNTVPPRRTLIRPATRGKSVQTLTANTIDTLNATSNVMGPPPLRTDTRNSRNDVARDGGVSKRASDSGPWSREALDLFGDKIYALFANRRPPDANDAAG